MDFDGFMDGEAFEGGSAKDYSLELGAKRMIPGFEDQLLGVKADEERTLKLKFPEEYHAKDLAGKDVEFKVKVHKVEGPALPELDDAFAERLFTKRLRDERFEAVHLNGHLL